MSIGPEPQRIQPSFRNKIWGSDSLAPWFDSPPGDRIGEVWFPSDDLLIKFLFTADNLSVQVHPDDIYANQYEKSRGKTEMWYILRADPGARIALGFKEPVTTERVLSAAQTGEIMEMINWIEVHAGESYFVPAGTVHALGAGLALCEIQQHSDVTYRLFDYGRDRELHLHPAMQVLQPIPHPGKSCPRDLGDGIQLLVECPYFRTYRATLGSRGRIPPELRIRLVVVLEKSGRLNGLPASPGQVFAAPGSHPWLVESDGIELLLIA